MFSMMQIEEVRLRFLPYKPVPNYLLPLSLHPARRCSLLEEAIWPGRGVFEARKKHSKGAR